jgi:hypothetical protein
MDLAWTNAARARTDQKLGYARVHLDELREHPFSRHSDFEHAHEEAFLFHLFGARDSFLAELNEYYECSLPRNGISMGKLREALSKRGCISQELQELHKLESDPASWYAHAKAMRDHSMHIHTVPRTFHKGGPTDGQIRLRHPITNAEMQRDFRDEFECWFSEMVHLLSGLRASAEKTCGVQL